MTEQFDPRSDVPTVLFLCIHNAGRSQMALGWFRHLAGERAIAWSGGSEPASEVNPVAIAAMAEVGIDITDEFPKPWADEVVRAADVVVTAGAQQGLDKNFEWYAAFGLMVTLIWLYLELLRLLAKLRER